MFESTLKCPHCKAEQGIYIGSNMKNRPIVKVSTICEKCGKDINVGYGFNISLKCDENSSLDDILKSHV